MGAANVLRKPVEREELLSSLTELASKANDAARAVLIVEDNAIQRDSIEHLLRSEAVQTVAVASAADALEKLRSSTFDCMVLDLALPDASGFELLEKMATDEAYSFPPVIVYTGRTLSADEEQQLRRYSKSIIIKGTRSPERLLDEVTLFLHRVEASLPAEQQRMLRVARSREAVFEKRRILLVEDDVRNVFAITRVLEPHGAILEIARNGREALDVLARQPGNRSGVDGHHDAGDGRLRSDAGDSCRTSLGEAAHHRAHRQGHAGRPAEMPAGRRQRLHHQAHRHRKAVVAAAYLDAGAARSAALRLDISDTEISQLLETRLPALSL